MSDDLISRQAAIDTLNGEIKLKNSDDVIAVEYYIQRVVRKLNELPSAELKMDAAAGTVCRKEEPMSRYGDADYDDLYYELYAFLINHRPSELLKLVQDAVEWWEEKNNEKNG